MMTQNQSWECETLNKGLLRFQLCGAGLFTDGHQCYNGAHWDQHLANELHNAE